MYLGLKRSDTIDTIFSRSQLLIFWISNTRWINKTKFFQRKSPKNIRKIVTSMFLDLTSYFSLPENENYDFFGQPNQRYWVYIGFK